MCLLIKTLLMKKPEKDKGSLVDNYTPDTARIEQNLSEMVQIKTVSTKENTYLDNMYKMHDYVLSRFTNIARVCELRDYNGGMMIKWTGKTDHKKPLVLMSHLDVVPALGEWDKDAFCGEINDGIIWGRGTVDTKGPLSAELEAVDSLIGEGFEPEQDVYILSSSREELGGEDVPNMVKDFEKDGIVPAIVLDEGGAIMDGSGVMPGMKGRYAMVAHSERAATKILVKAEKLKGKPAPALRIADFTKACAKATIGKREFPPLVVEMFTTLAPYMPFPLKYLFGNLNVFKGLLCKVIPKVSPEAAAMIGATVGFSHPTDEYTKDFVMGETATIVNLMFTPFVNEQECIDDIEAIAKKFDLTIKVVSTRPTPPAQQTGTDAYNYVKSINDRLFDDVVTAPFALFGGTDARHFIGKADAVLRYAPIYISPDEFKTFHNPNERISCKSIHDAVRFYREFIVGYKK